MSDLSASTSGGEPVSRASGKLEQAYLAVLDPSGFGTSNGTRESASQVVNFRFNPNEYVIEKRAQWLQEPNLTARDAGPTQWAGTNPRRLRVELFLDDSESESGSVVKDVEVLLSCCNPSGEGSSGPSSAPYVLFGWGSATTFLAVVSSVVVRYTMFHPDGTPYRAMAEVELQQVARTAGAQNPTSGGIAGRRVYVMQGGDSLALLAHREYGSASAWRAIAEANGVDDPFRIRPGQRLLLPASTERAGERRPAVLPTP
jgi:hypothetical protein